MAVEVAGNAALLLDASRHDGGFGDVLAQDGLVLQIANGTVAAIAVARAQALAIAFGCGFFAATAGQALIWRGRGRVAANGAALADFLDLGDFLAGRVGRHFHAEVFDLGRGLVRSGDDGRGEAEFQRIFAGFGRRAIGKGVTRIDRTANWDQGAIAAVVQAVERVPNRAAEGREVLDLAAADVDVDAFAAVRLAVAQIQAVADIELVARLILVGQIAQAHARLAGRVARIGAALGASGEQGFVVVDAHAAVADDLDGLGIFSRQIDAVFPSAANLVVFAFRVRQAIVGHAGCRCADAGGSFAVVEFVGRVHFGIVVDTAAHVLGAIDVFAAGVAADTILAQGRVFAGLKHHCAVVRERIA